MIFEHSATLLFDWLFKRREQRIQDGFGKGVEGEPFQQRSCRRELAPRFLAPWARRR